MRFVAAGLVASLVAGAAAACDYPGAPPNSPEARAAGAGIVWAGYSDATDRYRHGVLGDALEAGGLRVMTDAPAICPLAVILPEHSVFEDVGPRIADIDGDGRNDVVVVESRVDRGASLAVYGVRGDGLVKIAATPHIGTPNRWLAPAGIADFDGDGRLDIAYVDRPHLAKVLRVVTMEGNRLVEIAALPGFSNHRIGEAFISGGVRSCGDDPEIVLTDGSWRRIVAVRMAGGKLRPRDLGPFDGPESIARHLTC